MECHICANKAKKTIKCGFCDYETCSKCAETYVLDRPLNPTCMNCSKPWTRNALAERFGKTFLANRFKTAREKAMFEREKAMFPETQAYIEENEPRTKRQMLYEFDVDLRKIENMVIKFNKDMKRDHRAYDEFRVNQLMFKIARIRHDIAPAPNEARAEPKPKVVKVLTVKCANPECRGFVNAQNTRCGLCDAQTCVACRELATADHACNPATVETVKLLKKDTKPCPKCFVPIHKIDGCDQMFCVACHAAFSWNTGETTDGPIHNPHYFEYARLNDIQIPRNAACGQIPQMYEIPLSKRTDAAVLFVRQLVHFDRVVVHHFNGTVPNNLRLRTMYLLNQLDEKTFVKKIQEDDKRCSKNREYRDILTTFVAAGSDILRAYATTDETEEWRVKCANGLYEYVNEQLMLISKTYGSVLYRVIADSVDLFR